MSPQRMILIIRAVSVELLFVDQFDLGPVHIVDEKALCMAKMLIDLFSIT